MKLNSPSRHSVYSSIDKSQALHTIDKNQSQFSKRKSVSVQRNLFQFNTYISLIHSLLRSFKRKSSGYEKSKNKIVFKNKKNTISATDTISVKDLKRAIKTLNKAKNPHPYYFIDKDGIHKV